METAMVYFSTKGHWTDEEFMALPNDGRKYELLEGKLLMSPVIASHGSVCVNIVILMGTYVHRHKLGQVYDSSTGFRLSDDVLLSPDVAFVSKARLKKILVAPDKFLYGAPDLVVEVVSPSDRLKHINEKLDHYFEHDTRLAWVVDWKKREVTVHSPDNLAKLTRPNDVLTGGDVLRGFKCKLSKLFGSAY